jgi:hypothetical protein
LYHACHCVQDYINEVVDQLRYLSNNHFASFPLMQKLVFFRETRHAFGRTALLLSGGASLTMYHLGVVRALYEGGLLPRVISGSSGGSIVAAWICTATDEELMSRLQPGAIKMDPFEQLSVGSVRRKVWKLVTHGVLFPRFLPVNLMLNPCIASSLGCGHEACCLTSKCWSGSCITISVMSRFWKPTDARGAC